jgi:diguanylate cyclase (GGDEF)-like protein/PAS domain S-box-containing protein
MEMLQPTSSTAHDSLSPVGGVAVEEQLSRLSSLAGNLGEVPGGKIEQFEDQLVEARLGIGSSLFKALRAKHPPTAAHSLRVAIGCSAWGLALGLPEEERDTLEVAALLHDVGKLGVPDAVLLKPGALDEDEVEVMARHRGIAQYILQSSCASSEVIDIIQSAPAWYDGRRAGFKHCGRAIPLGARMLAVVDAFDSMTTDHVYRAAMSRERALAELFEYAGSQFDPDLIELFQQLHDKDQFKAKVARRWLQELDPSSVNLLWRLQPGVPTLPPLRTESMFQEKLLENMHDGVIFVDRALQIISWNRGAERLTGISSASICQHTWSPTLIDLRDEKGNELVGADCPLTHAVSSGVQSLQRLKITGRDGHIVAVDLHVVPVSSPDGAVLGAAAIMHDASPEASLEKRCQRLHEKATTDPLTGVSNRAEFDRTHDNLTTAHLEKRLPYSLIICDIDHFKLINDNYGHQAGDEALISFAQLLKTMNRPGDLVARYGGEEFVMLCPDCSNAAAADRAEQVRLAISSVSLQCLSGKNITVSFGVTELQPGDTAETMLRRADRALLEAKARGRNTVVQLGSGFGELREERRQSGFRFWRSAQPSLLLERVLVTAVPLAVTIEKLRGFIADYHAQILTVDGDTIRMKIESEQMGMARRTGDRAVPFVVELQFSEERPQHASPSDRLSKTKVHVTIRPKRDRDRRRSDALERARHVMSGIKSYLVATEADVQTHKNALRRATNVLVHWLRKDE